MRRKCKSPTQKTWWKSRLICDVLVCTLSEWVEVGMEKGRGWWTDKDAISNSIIQIIGFIVVAVETVWVGFFCSLLISTQFLIIYFGFCLSAAHWLIQLMNIMHRLVHSMINSYIIVAHVLFLLLLLLSDLSIHNCYTITVVVIVVAVIAATAAAAAAAAVVASMCKTIIHTFSLTVKYTFSETIITLNEQEIRVSADSNEKSIGYKRVQKQTHRHTYIWMVPASMTECIGDDWVC